MHTLDSRSSPLLEFFSQTTFLQRVVGAHLRLRIAKRGGLLGGCQSGHYRDCVCLCVCAGVRVTKEKKKN